MLKGVKETLSSIIEDVLEGKIKLEELYTRWPSKDMNEELYVQMFEDIEDAIEHTPFKFLSKEVNYKVWEKSKEYKKVLYYRALITSENPDDSDCKSKHIE